MGYVPNDSPFWPGLVIDRSQPLERRGESRFKQKQEQAGSTKASAAAKAGKSSPKTESEPAAAEPAETAAE